MVSLDDIKSLTQEGGIVKENLLSNKCVFVRVLFLMKKSVCENEKDSLISSECESKDSKLSTI